MLNKIKTILLTSFFEWLYHQGAWSYDAVAWVVSLGRWNSWISQAVQLVEGETILELGSGPGHLLQMLKNSGYRVIGLDKSFPMCKKAFRRLSRADIVNASGGALPFTPTHFDTIVATFPAPYLFDQETLHEIRRILKPGGRLVVLLSAIFSDNSPVEKTLAWIYHFTGQSRSIDSSCDVLLNPLVNSGLQPEIRMVTVHKNRLVFILAKNTPAKGRNFAVQ
jgi:ubiquinone/menaquinone biosynthesis C-methylase UbiE